MKSFSLFLIFTLTFLIFNTQSGAQVIGSRWETYQDDSGAFEVSLPHPPELKIQELRLTPTKKVYTTSFTSVDDQRPYRPDLKTFSVNFQQTWGPGLTDEKLYEFVQRDLARKAQSLERAQFDIKYIREHYFDGKPGYEYHVTYQDDELGTQAIKSRFIYTDATRLEQSFIGNDFLVKDVQTNHFFGSIDVQDGVGRSNGSFREDWKLTPSPTGLFRVRHPKEKNIYFPNELDIQQPDDRSEYIRMVFYDPIWEYAMFYNVYAYRFDKSLNETRVKQILVRNHLQKHAPRRQNFEFDMFRKLGLPIMETSAGITLPNAKFPYMNTVRVRASYTRNMVMIQEIMGHHFFARSDFADNLLNLTDFTPGIALNFEEDAKLEKVPPKVERSFQLQLD